jgi:site-specific DNA-methyltransferase (adenine-specific)
VFPGTQIKGGVCFFLWNRDNRGPVNVVTHDRGRIVSADERPLREPGSDVFIRYNKGVQILRRVKKIEIVVHGGVGITEAIGYPSFSSLVSSLRPFGLRTYFQGKTSQGRNDYKIYQNGGVAFVKKNEITGGHDLIPHWKVFIPRAGSGSDSFPHPILGRPFVGEPESVCTETYLCIGPLKSKRQAENVCSYLSTRFVRFLVLLHKPSQDATRSVYSFVPIQDFSNPWSDEDLYRRYKLTADEIAFIESLVRPGWDANE